MGIYILQKKEAGLIKHLLENSKYTIGTFSSSNFLFFPHKSPVTSHYNQKYSIRAPFFFTQDHPTTSNFKYCVPDDFIQLFHTDIEKSQHI